MNEHPDYIQVEESRRQTIEADRADLFVTIRGASLITGQAALKKAREVAQLVSDLAAFGIEEARIKLQSVHAETTSGMLSKTSTATYNLKIIDVATDALADVLGIVTSQKNTTLSSIQWRYPDDETLRDNLLDQCLCRANDKARRIAQTMNVKLSGVYEMSENFIDGEDRSRDSTRDFMEMPAASMMRARVSSEELGLAVSHSKEITVSVEIKYRVSGFEKSA